MSWLTDKIAWRYINFSGSYFDLLKIGKAFPEIHDELNRNSFWQIVKWPVYGTLFLVFSPLLIPWAIVEWYKDHKVIDIDIDWQCMQSAAAAREKVPSWKIAKLLGRPYDKILETYDGEE